MHSPAGILPWIAVTQGELRSSESDITQEWLEQTAPGSFSSVTVYCRNIPATASRALGSAVLHRLLVWFRGGVCSGVASGGTNVAGVTAWAVPALF